MENKGERTRAEVAGCREAMPALLEPLWLTIAHAPDQVLLDAADALRGEIPDDSERLVTFLTWLGHGSGDCPVCWMLVGRLPYSITGWVARLGPALDGAPDLAWTGACRFLATRLQPRHALPSGVSRESLKVILAELEGLDASLKARLAAHWASLGGAAGELPL